MKKKNLQKPINKKTLQKKLPREGRGRRIEEPKGTIFV